MKSTAIKKKTICSQGNSKKMLVDGERVESLRLYIIRTKFWSITVDPKLTDAQILMITGLLDEVSPKGVFKELNGEIRKSLKAAKQESQSDTEKISGFEENDQNRRSYSCLWRYTFLTATATTGYEIQGTGINCLFTLSLPDWRTSFSALRSFWRPSL